MNPKIKSFNQFPMDNIREYIDNSLDTFLDSKGILEGMPSKKANEEKGSYCLLVATAVKQYFDNYWKNTSTPESDVVLGTAEWTGFRQDRGELKNIGFREFDLMDQKYHAWNLLPFKEGLYLIDFNVAYYFIKEPFNNVFQYRSGKHINTYKKLYKSNLPQISNGFFKYTAESNYAECKNSLDVDITKDIEKFTHIFLENIN